MILITVLVCYLSLGAVILQRLETRTEVQLRTEQLVEIQHVYNSAINLTWEILEGLQISNPKISREEWEAELKKHLQKVSARHELNSNFLLERELDNYRNSTTKWTFPTALLYALTVLTTCGKMILVCLERP